MLNLQEKKHRFTPLMLALAQQPPSFEEIFQTLLKGKPDLNVQDSSGQTVLHLATEYEEETVLKLLLKSKANVNAVDMKKMTALHIAVGKGNLEIVQLLIETGRANVNAVDGKGNTPLHWACIKNGDNQLEMISYLISKLNSQKLLRLFVIAIGQGPKPLRNTCFYATNVAAIAHSKKRVVANSKETTGIARYWWVALVFAIIAVLIAYFRRSHPFEHDSKGLQISEILLKFKHHLSRDNLFAHDVYSIMCR
ncbi:hypothetical protein PsorP6_009588 [Peronosclerospora sorghi]|uniref:Uncharacterized protein n=1 Tax=Peronosclerospora sorghi TaxID=230839 RepID=A0ACC0W0U8_9STRA|nr:hypothetical protein PsorP6_009588 [Peronosclerospora sorghi]